MRNSAVGKRRTGSPGVLSANGPIPAAETEGVEFEVDVKGKTGRGADWGMGEKEEEKREEGGEPGHC